MPIGVYERKLKDSVGRFLDLAEPEPNTGCWIFTGYLDKDFRGKFGLNGKIVAASRFSYETFIGPIPDGMLVLHRCDFSPCVNPEHFFLGTHKINSFDMSLKGRGVKSKKGLPFGVAILPSGRYRAHITFEMGQMDLGVYDDPIIASTVAVNKIKELRSGVVNNGKHR